LDRRWRDRRTNRNDPEPTDFGRFEIYTFKIIHQNTFGLDVSVFPRIFLPSPSQAGDPYGSIRVPIWLQKDWGPTSAFGGGGSQFSLHDATRNFCLYGATITRQVQKDFQLGVEVFHQTSDGNGGPTRPGLGARYDLDEHDHLLGYVARGSSLRPEVGRGMRRSCSPN
jgi:hypothetical protein